MNKLLYVLGLLVACYIGGAVTYNFMDGYQQLKPETEVFQKTEKVVESTNVYDLFTLVNKERSKRKLSPLLLDESLNKSALDKCEDMIKRNYWSHETPKGEEPWVFIEKYEPGYIKAGENLAKGFENSDKVVEGWMASETHRKNIVDSEYNHVGYGVCSEDFGQQRVVQHFVYL